MPPTGIHPIPDTNLPRVFGLLEVLDDRNGREDGYRLARDLNYDLGELLKVMKAGEILGLVDTPGGDIVLQPLGKKFLESDINERKLILRERLRDHGLFNYLVRLLKGQENRSVDTELVKEHLAMLLPNEDPERLFNTIVNWGRFAELFGYNKDEERFYLDQE
ncbi:MAG TPA: AAA-associated domain-containing protein [Candidatus Binataceae bacterium]|jgi:NitT/TauT family transport system ATP-binding protein|nr:AAA-associated domain-containing protein [Candidatus Binataceae bacterium]